MNTESAADSTRTNATLAPRWHTAALVALLLAVAVTGTLLQGHGATSRASQASARVASARILTQYVPLLIVNWGLFAYCALLFREPAALAALLGERWRSAGRVCADLGLALGTGILILSLEFASRSVCALGRNAAVVSLLPSTGAERLTWALVAVSVGFCEEVVYRGYLQKQLKAITGSGWVAVALQALLFGMAHGEQGAAAALRMTVYGAVLGVVATWRRSLVPGILSHVGIDLVSGLLHR